MNETIELIEGVPHKTYEIGIQDIIGQQMQSYALLLVILSFVMLIYVMWNNFVRSPSKKKGLKELIKDETSFINPFGCDDGIEPSSRVKRISRALDEYLIIPALVMLYITISYYFSIGV